MGDGGFGDPHSLRRSAWASRATAAPMGRFPLFVVLIHVADEHPAFKAGTRTLQTSIVCLYSVILLLNGWLRAGCARLLYGHEVPPRGPDPGVCQHLRGHIFIRQLYYTVLFLLCLRNCATILGDVNWRNGRGERAEIEGTEAAKSVDTAGVREAVRGRLQHDLAPGER